MTTSHCRLNRLLLWERKRRTQRERVIAYRERVALITQPFGYWPNGLTTYIHFTVFPLLRNILAHIAPSAVRMFPQHHVRPLDVIPLLPLDATYATKGKTQ